jgi:hypothetical protein
MNKTMIGMAYRPLADMESGGVYFERPDEDVIEEICHYSGLPSVSSYDDSIEQTKTDKSDIK